MLRCPKFEKHTGNFVLGDFFFFRPTTRFLAWIVLWVVSQFWRTMHLCHNFLTYTNLAKERMGTKNEFFTWEIREIRGNALSAWHLCCLIFGFSTVKSATSSQVPSDERCTWDRQKLKLQIERGTMWGVPDFTAVNLGNLHVFFTAKIAGIYDDYTGCWFQTFFIFHNIWDNPSHWLIFFKTVKTTNQYNHIYIWWFIPQKSGTVLIWEVWIYLHLNRRSGFPQLHQKSSAIKSLLSWRCLKL